VVAPYVELPAPVTSFLRAVNSCRAQEVAGAFTQDAVIDDCGRQVTGHRAVQGWCDRELIRDPCRVTVQAARVFGDEVQVRAQMISLGFNGPMRMSFKVADGRVASLSLSE